MAKSTTKIVRVYAGRDVSMLTALSVIMGAAVANKTFLFSKRSNWNDAYFKALIDEIKRLFKDVLGISGLGDQVKASKELYKAMEEVLPKLKTFKTAVEIDFEDDAREKQILDLLGFKLWKKVERGNQEALAELLATFSKNMDAKLKKEITDAGTDVAYINDIISYADVIRDKNITQENKKGEKKNITEDGIAQLNKIYTDVMKVAKHSANLFAEKKDTANAEKFVYSKILANLSNSKIKESKNKGEEAKSGEKK